MKRVALYLATGFEEIEALTTVDILRRAEIHVDIISIEKKLNVVGSNGIEIVSNLLIEDIDHRGYDMMVLPGGMPGTINLNNSEILKEQILNFNLEKKYIGAICAAPLILGKMRFLEGRRATCYPGVEPNLLGATYCEDLDVVVDGNFITSRGIGTAINFTLKLVELLKDEDTKNTLFNSLLAK